MTAYFFLFIAVTTAVVSQLLTKFQMQRAGEMPADIKSQLVFLLTNLLSVPVIIAIAMTFISGLSWLGVLSKLSLGQAYPYMLLVFPIILYSFGYCAGPVVATIYLTVYFGN